MKKFITIISIISLSLSSWAQNPRSLMDELKSTDEAKSKMMSLNKAAQKSLSVDAMWGLAVAERSDENTLTVKKSIESMNLSQVAVHDLVRLMALGNRVKISNVKLTSLKNLVTKKLTAKLNLKTLMVIFNLEEDFKALKMTNIFNKVVDNNKKIKLLFDQSVQSTAQILNKELVSDLYHHNVPASFGDRSQIFVFCRSNRAYPCLLVIKDHRGYPVYDSKGELWSTPVLAHSRLNVPFNQSNGDTPSGLYYINGVMPTADQQIYYGNFRRLIMNFFSTTINNTSEMVSALPTSHANLSWWKPVVIAKDVGRDFLRIHGEGEIINDQTTPYYPLIPSLGCIKLREGKYGDQDYTDQRKLLDQLMKAQGPRGLYKNETEIRAILYVINLDDQEKAVSLSDIKALIQ